VPDGYLSPGTIHEAGGRSLPLPRDGFEADLLEAGRGGAAADLLQQLFQGTPPRLAPADRQALATEILDLDLTAGRLLDELEFVDQFLELVLAGDAELTFVSAGTPGEGAGPAAEDAP